MPKLKENEFYCVVCRARILVFTDDICVKEYKNKRSSYGFTPTLKSHC